MPLRIGTRGSPLALWQAHWVKDALGAAHPGLEVEITTLRTRAENFPERPIEAIGAGVFTAELDAALLRGDVDIAVHSLKDVPSQLPSELVIAAVPERESPYDCFISADSTSLAELPEGARVGTGSPRRRAQLLAQRHDLEVVPLRGNVDTRLRKISAEGLAGTFLAHAGLRRLGKEDVIRDVLPADVMMPAVSQGALGICARGEDERTRGLLSPLNHAPSHQRVLAERSFLRRLQGGCQVPAGALATIEATLRLTGVLAAPDGSVCLRGVREGPADEGAKLGEELADDLLGRGGEAVLERLRKEEG